MLRININADKEQPCLIPLISQTYRLLCTSTKNSICFGTSNKLVETARSKAIEL